MKDINPEVKTSEKAVRISNDEKHKWEYNVMFNKLSSRAPYQSRVGIHLQQFIVHLEPRMSLQQHTHTHTRISIAKHEPSGERELRVGIG